MCIDPVTIGLTATEMFMISTALTIATGVAGYMGQQQMAEQAAQAAERGYQIDRQAATARQFEESQSAAQKMLDNQRAALRATATATVSAGENGTYGNSVNELIRSIGFQQGTIDSREKLALENTNRSLEFQNQAAGVRRNNTIIQNPMPNALGSALSIGGDIFSSYNRFFPPKPAGMVSPAKPT